MRIEGSRWVIALSAGVLAVVVAAAVYFVPRRRARVEPAMPPPEAARPEAVDPWKEAALKVEEDRGEPTGRQAKPEIPAQLRHASDRRRFLGVQVAEWRKHRFETPHDYAGLVPLMRGGELVEVPPLGKDFILYGVGYSAGDEPFTHYDKATDRSVTLYGTDEELGQEYEQLAESRTRLEETIKALKTEAAAVPRKERERKKELDEQLKDEGKSLAAVKKRVALLDDFYKQPKRRAQLAEEHEALAALARDFGGQSFDLQDAAARKRLKAAMLSYLRPAALAVLEEVARAYKEKFARQLPVTSLVRTDEYQRQLNETNPNATLIDVPPHTTGLAFDIYYRHMTAAEQEFVMAELARLEDAGRVEALRELRDHFHIFVFAEGRPPAESLVRETLGLKEEPKKKDDKKKDDKAKPAKKAAAAKAKPPAKKRAPARRKR